MNQSVALVAWSLFAFILSPSRSSAYSTASSLPFMTYISLLKASELPAIRLVLGFYNNCALGRFDFDTFNCLVNLFTFKILQLVSYIFLIDCVLGSLREIDSSRSSTSLTTLPSFLYNLSLPT